MPTVSQQIEQNNRARYEQFEAERFFVDEITDLSERIPIPMKNTFEYEMGMDGELYHLGQSLGEVLRSSVKAAQLAEQQQLGRFARHVAHTYIELDEYDAQRELACGSEDDDDLLVVISPRVDELGKHLTMVRVYTRTEAGISATSISFDVSDNQCLDNIGHFFGQSISQDASPEDILSMRFWGKSADVPSDDIRTFIAHLHDVILEETRGGVWSGGRQGTTTLDAQTFIRSQEDILSEHMGVIRALKARSGDDVNRLLEEARYDTAAQLTERFRGNRESSNREEAGELARQNGEVFDNSCPTYNVELGFTGFREGSCRVCLKKRLVGGCSVCYSCELADTNDSSHKVLDIIHKNALTRLALAERASLFTTRSSEERLSVAHTASVNTFYIAKPRVVIGGMVNDIYDRSTGQLIRTEKL